MYKESKITSYRSWLQHLTLGSVTPFFHPILSIENKSVLGYETLGRLQLPSGDIISLGGFFTAKFYMWPENKQIAGEILDQYRKIDNLLHFQALELLKKDVNQESKLFINVAPSLLTHKKQGKKYLEDLVAAIRQFELAPERIVIEITEEYIQTGLKSLKPKIEYLKQIGCMIAIDDLGSQSSNFDRIGFLQPDIIKIDMQLLKLSVVDRNYERILYTIAQLSESLGISILYEGIETEEELFHAMSHGSRYVQGFLFSKPKKKILRRDNYSNELNELLRTYSLKSKDRVHNRVQWEQEIENKLDCLNITYQSHSPFQYQAIFEVDINIFRIFITDNYGNQVYGNMIRANNEEIILDDSDSDNNWCWRPYYLNHIYHSYRQPSRWVISNSYRDILTNNILKTFSLTLKNDYIIFIDLIYKSSGVTQ